MTSEPASAAERAAALLRAAEATARASAGPPRAGAAASGDREQLLAIAEELERRAIAARGAVDALADALRRAP